MDGKENVLEAILEGESLEDVDMLDAETIEEGEFYEHNQCIESTEGGEKDENIANQESHSKNRRRRTKKKKNKKKSGPISNVTDINRFVIDTCRRLKERKSYLVWNAVGCLGVSALSDLVKEVDAIQACGGQMTADGKRYRSGGGILWSIMKAREPRAYKEIMAKGKEFEKQFRQPNIRKEPERHKEAPERTTALESSDPIEDQVSNGSKLTSKAQDDHEQSVAPQDRVSVMSRIRVPVAYDDLFEEDAKDEPT